MENMKKVLVLFAALFVMCGTVSAQNLLESLKGVAGALIDEATGGKATEVMLPGTWSYSEPAIKLVSDNALTDALASSATSSVETKLEKVYKAIGIKSGSCMYVFNADKSFTAQMGKHSLSGTYTYDAATHAIELKYSTKLLNLGTMKGYAYLDGDSLDLVFDCSKLMTFLSKLGSKVSALNGITKIVNSFNGMMVGFEFDRK